MVIYGPRHQNLQETKRGIAKLIYNSKNYGFSILITIDNWVSKPTNITGGAHIVCATNLAFLFGCPEHLGENICEGTSRKGLTVIENIQTKVGWPSTHGSTKTSCTNHWGELTHNHEPWVVRHQVYIKY